MSKWAYGFLNESGLSIKSYETPFDLLNALSVERDQLMSTISDLGEQVAEIQKVISSLSADTNTTQKYTPLGEKLFVGNIN